MKKLNIVLFGMLIVFSVGMFVLFHHMSNKKETVRYPFFASTKFSVSNVRSGPGEEFPVIMIYKVKHLPLKVIAYYKDWYQTVDSSSRVGWIYSKTVSSYRSAISIKRFDLLDYPLATAKKVATVDKDIIMQVILIKGDYAKVVLRVDNKKIKGWALRENLWGSIF